MNLFIWARKWHIHEDAVRDLALQMGIDPSQPQDYNLPPLKTEADVLKHRRMVLARAGGLAWRNNVGATTDANGNMVRFGLANESTSVNKKVKSSDLIGIQPVLVTHDMIGLTIGQFVAEECKRPGWKWSGNEHELAQRKFHELVISKGGVARFTTGS
jgi:hypothetical protein